MFGRSQSSTRERAAPHSSISRARWEKKRESSHALLLKPSAFFFGASINIGLPNILSTFRFAFSRSAHRQIQRTNLLIVVVRNSGRHRCRVLELRRAGRVSGARGRKKNATTTGDERRKEKNGGGSDGGSPALSRSLPFSSLFDAVGELSQRRGVRVFAEAEKKKERAPCAFKKLKSKVKFGLSLSLEQE